MHNIDSTGLAVSLQCETATVNDWYINEYDGNTYVGGTSSPSCNAQYDLDSQDISNSQILQLMPGSSAPTTSNQAAAPNNQPSVSHCLGQAASNGRGLALGADLVGDVATGFAIANPASATAIFVGLAATSVGTLNAINHFSWSGGAIAGANQTVAATGVLTHGLEVGSFIRTGTSFSKALMGFGILGSVVSTVSDATAAISAYRTCRAGG